MAGRGGALSRRGRPSPPGLPSPAARAANGRREPRKPPNMKSQAEKPRSGPARNRHLVPAPQLPPSASLHGSPPPGGDAPTLSCVLAPSSSCPAAPLPPRGSARGRPKNAALLASPRPRRRRDTRSGPVRPPPAPPASSGLVPGGLPAALLEARVPHVRR